MKVYVMGTSMAVSTTVSLEDLKLLQAKKPEALSLVEKVDDENVEKFRVLTGANAALQKNVACFNGSTNGTPKMAMMTIDISGKPENKDAKEYAVEKYGEAILNLQKVEAQFQPALDEIATQSATLAGLIEEIDL